MKNVITAYVKETLALRDQIEGAFLTLGERLDKIRVDSLWKGAYESWSEFLEEMRISEATASKMILVFRTYVLEYKLPITRLQKAGWSNLYTAIPLLKAGNSIDEILEKAMTLRRADIQSEVREKEAGDHKHDWETYKFRMCKVCKTREMVE